MIFKKKDILFYVCELVNENYYNLINLLNFETMFICSQIEFKN